MLEVHPPHQAVRGWRDFFVHITTIVIGLLIAISLEQVVESIHHKHQVRDAREALALEREANQHEFARTTEMFRRETAQQTGVTALMPQPEVRAAERLYRSLGVVQASNADRLHAIGTARRYMALDADPAHLTPAQLAEEVALAEAVLIAHYRLGGDMRNLHTLNGDFAPAPETDELRAIVHEGPMTEDEKRDLTPSIVR